MENLLELEISILSHPYVLLRDACALADLFSKVSYCCQICADFELQLLKQIELDAVLN